MKSFQNITAQNNTTTNIIRQNEITSQVNKGHIYDSISEMSRTGSSVESGSKLVAAQDQAVGIVDKENDNRKVQVSFRGDENAPKKLTVRWLHTSVNVLKTTECML